MEAKIYEEYISDITDSAGNILVALDEFYEHTHQAVVEGAASAAPGPVSPVNRILQEVIKEVEKSTSGLNIRSLCDDLRSARDGDWKALSERYNISI